LIAALAHRDVHLVARRLLQSEVSHVADNAHYTTFAIAGVEDDFSQRILAGPECSCQRLVDDDTWFAGRCIAIGDVTSGEYGNSHRGSVTIAHDARECEWKFAALVDHAFRGSAPGAIAPKRECIRDG